MNTVNDSYHSLLARHDAMRLRRRLLSPGARQAAEGAGAETGAPPQRPYDGASGAADQRVITDHLELVTPFGDLIAHLYDAMFAHWPYLRRLFPESMEFQRTHLEGIFRYLIENLHDPDEVASVFTRLGRDHRKLGVRRAHYRAFEAALCEALRRTAGPRWNETMERAWVRMLRFAVAAMVEGAEAALAEPPAWQATVTGHDLRRADLAVLRVRTHEPYPYRAGQYASVASPLLPQAWRQYSLACAPRPDGELEFHVRLTGRGGVSEALVAGTRVGDTLRLGPASGTMTLDDDLAHDLLLVASGTGWAAAKALLQELASRRAAHRAAAHRRAHLFLGVRHPSALYDTEAPDELRRRYPWLQVTQVVGEGPGPGEHHALAEVVAGHGGWSRHLAYVSGPPSMAGPLVARLTAGPSPALPAARIRHDPLPDRA
ncbi:globin domain-containing protein [Streptomyces hiroshimensis]|uniref:nitric oxide dioxygenase n=1 Tax=Streptomyces hiroshimensis TaxID=66424 RepID=A0ABQ2YU76_9ACTN|nr:globin domain-containing protein [Streptomyces hiroshimensis]GGX93497.1 oxidoreductase [Streptomyces hiroshimensis]